MPSIALNRTDVIVGVDTHKERNVAVTVDGLGGRLADESFPATADGHAAMVSWAVALDGWSSTQSRVPARMGSALLGSCGDTA